MIRREFIKRAVASVLAAVAGTTLAATSVACPGSQVAYKPRVIYIVQYLVGLHKANKLKNTIEIKQRPGQTLGRTDMVYENCYSSYYGPENVLNTLDFQDIANLMFEKTGVAYYIHACIEYTDEGSQYEICYLLRHGKAKQMTMFSKFFTIKILN